MADITVMNKQEQEINTGATQENTATQKAVHLKNLSPDLHLL